MSLPLEFHPEVYDDLAVAQQYYDARQAALGDRFVAAVEAAYARIQAAPELYGVVRGTTRSAPVRRFPYAVYYQVEPNRIYVLAVHHHSRDPAVWQGRT